MKAKLQGYSVYLDPVLDQAIITYLKDQRNNSATLREWLLRVRKKITSGAP